MAHSVARTLTIAAILSAAAALAACAESRLRMQPDFGEAVRQDSAAQVADPDAHYAGVPAPGSNGRRVVSAEERYEKGKVIEPASTQTQTVVAAPSGGAGGGEAAPSGAQ